MKTAILLLLAVTGSLSSTPDETRLRKLLFQNYDKESLPHKPTNVSIRLHVLTLDLDEAGQQMEVNAWISMEWYDYALSWQKTDYPDVENLAVNPRFVWRPDIRIYNSDTSFFDTFTRTQVLVFPEGKIIWVPPVKVVVPCLMDLTYWPNDIQNCSVKIGSWVHSASDIDLFPKDDMAEMESPEMVLNKDAPWRVLNNTVRKVTKTYGDYGDYVNIRATFIMQRVASVFLWTVKLPAIGLLLVPLVLFLLPPGCMEKSVVGVLILVLDLLFLNYTSSAVKHSSAHAPLIIQLVSEQFLVTLVCLFLCIITARLARGPCHTTMPECLRRPLAAMASALCLAGYRKLVVRSVEGSYPQSIKGEEADMEKRGMMAGCPAMAGNSSEQVEWLLLAAILDRLLLTVYCVILSIKMTAFCGLF